MLSTVSEDERRTIGELKKMGMSGLVYTFSFIQPSGDRGNILIWVTQLVDKMIESRSETGMRGDGGFAVARIGSLLIIPPTTLGVLLGYWGTKKQRRKPNKL